MDSQSLNMPYLLVAGAMVFAVIFGFAVINPAINTIFETQNQIEELQTELAEKETFLRTLDSKMAELEINRDHEARLATVLPEEERMEDALRILHQSAEASGLQIERVNNNSDAIQSEILARQARGQATQLPEDVLPLSVDVSYVSTYQNLRAFLAAIERTPRLMDVHAFTIQRDPEEPEILFGEMQVEFYTISRNKEI